MRITIDHKTSLAHGNFGSKAGELICVLEGRKSWVRYDRLQFETSQHNISTLLLHFPDADITDNRRDLSAFDSGEPVRVAKKRRPFTPDFVMPPLDFQLANFEKFKDKDVYAIFSEQGTGKTKTQIDITCYRARLGTATGMLVLSIPKGVHAQWIDEQLPKHWWPSVPRLEYIWDGKPKSIPAWVKRGSPNGEFQVISGNIDMIRSKDGLALIEAFAFAHKRGLIICIDEADSIKNQRSNRNKVLRDVAKYTRQRCALTGTPIAKDLTDEFGIFYWLDPDIIGHKYLTSFRAQYCIMGGYEGREVIGHKNIEQFKAITAPHVFRATKRQLKLPEKVYDSVVFDLTDKQKRMIADIREEFFTELEGGQVTAAHGAAAVIKIQQVSNGFVRNDDGDLLLLDNPRMDAMIQLRRDIDGPLIIWARFQEDVEALHKEFHSTSVVFYGPSSAAQRKAAKEAFIRGDARDFIATPGAAGRGVDGLQTVCSNAVYYSQGYNAIERWQSEDRTHRLGTKGSATYFDLIGRGSADRAIIRNLRKKKALSDMVLDGEAATGSLQDAIDIMKGIG